MAEYFALRIPSPHMLIISPCNKFAVEEIPAVVHKDNTARIQTVTAKENNYFYELLQHTYQKTGCPVVLNTSFNRSGEPIVSSPRDAINWFLNTKLDVLVLEDYLLIKK
jgi:carbamoyltransferase